MDPFAVREFGGQRSSRTSPRAPVLRFSIFAVLLAAFLLGTVGVDLYTEWLWFDALGYLSVFTTILETQALLFLCGAVGFGILFALNVMLTRRLSRSVERVSSAEDEGLWAFVARIGSRLGEEDSYRRLVTAGLALLGCFLATVMGLVLSSQWQLVMRFVFGGPFGRRDPVFSQDLALYIFQLPFFRLLHSWLFTAIVLIAGVTLALYAVIVVYEISVSLERSARLMPRPIKAHLAALAGVMFLLTAAHHVMDVYELLYSTRGAAYGASYTDVRVQAPLLWVMALSAVLAAAMTVGSIFTRGWRLPVLGLTQWVGVVIVGGFLIPAAVEGLEVKPNQREKERPYIQNTIQMTRQAYGLDDVQEQFFPADESVTAEDIRANQETVRNIRLWDHRPLLDTLRQIQSIRAYYTFEDVDVDRYRLAGGYQQVMLAVRELDRESLRQQAPSWINQTLKFTHGYGVAMVLVSAIAEEGRPKLILQDVPPRGEIPLDRPEVYYGQRGSRPYVVVKTTEKEFDYPSGDQNVESTYQGSGGVNVGTYLTRLAYALKFRDVNLLLTNALTSDSEILYRRNIVERVQRLAPFLILDSDPYAVVARGRLFWILDAYTYTDRYPYSEPRVCGRDATRLLRCQHFGARLNYIRNSVKVVVDAYDGTTTLFLHDPTDPLISVYRQAFGGLFRPLNEMDPELRSHLRYPEDLFSIQADVFRLFHMEDPNVFYNREDLWALADEKFDQVIQPVLPYYIIMRLPEAEREEFLLMLPFTPREKANMIAWLAARSDGDLYGKLLVYKFPKERLIYGPSQFESRIDQDPRISAQLTLWGQRGSKVIRGNTLVIPIGRSNLYVEPLYLQSDSTQSRQGAIPELKQVILSTGNRLVMEPTLEQALQSLFGTGSASAPTAPQATTSAPAPGGATPDQRTFAALAQSANEHFLRSQEALRAGNWTLYGEEQRLLQEDLKRLFELSGQ